MNVTEILAEVNTIFIDVLENSSIRLTEETTAKDVEEWDSLTHIQLILAIEKHFQFRFTSQEIMGWKNVGAMCHSIEQKLSQK